MEPLDDLFVQYLEITILELLGTRWHRAPYREISLLNLQLIMMVVPLF